MNGVKTSEFYLTVLVIGAATVLLLTNNIDSETWKWAVTGATAFYTASRAYLKAQAAGGDAQVAEFKTDLETLARTQSSQEPPAAAKPATRRESGART